MRKIVISSVIILSSIILNAQTANIPVGRNLVILTESKVSNSVSVMGQQMEIMANTNLTVDALVKAVTDTSITTTITIKKLAGSANAMGQEANFDSDEKNAKSNSMFAAAFKNINKPEDIIIANGKVKGKLDIGTTGIPSNGEIAKKLFLLIEPANIKLGFKWSEIYDYQGFKGEFYYTITKVAADGIEVTGTSDIKIDNTVQQMGMDMKQSITGTTTSISIYDPTTGLLKADASKSEMSGTIQVMGNDAPLNVKIVTTTTVK